MMSPAHLQPYQMKLSKQDVSHALARLQDDVLTQDAAVVGLSVMPNVLPSRNSGDHFQRIGEFRRSWLHVRWLSPFCATRPSGKADITEEAILYS